MQRYKCHKEVLAAKIEKIEIVLDGDAVLTLDGEKRGCSAFWMKRHNPVVGGYYVEYQDGYASFSPAKAFEEGYTRI